MKKVLLLGDSIRQGYQEYVKYTLRDIADVYYPNDNGKFCQLTLRYFHDWARILSKDWSFEFDIIHFNSGLWDILRLSNEEECFNTPEEYQSLLKRIIDRIRYFYPNAKLIFALTTKVQEPGFPYGDSIAVRKNSDIEKYNGIAIEVCKENKIEVNDLWSVSNSCPEDAYSDNVHFNTKKGESMFGGGGCKLHKKILLRRTV